MTKPILELKNVTTVVNRGTASQTTILKGINLTINPGDFITIVGTNGAGKSTLFNVVGGNLTADGGQLLHNGQDITHLSQEGRTKFLARVFQDPKLGTAPRMTVAENLLLAEKRGQSRHLVFRRLKSRLTEFKTLVATMNNGLENRLMTATGALSGGQRQALSFLMATLKRTQSLGRPWAKLGLGEEFLLALFFVLPYHFGHNNFKNGGLNKPCKPTSRTASLLPCKLTPPSSGSTFQMA